MNLFRQLRLEAGLTQALLAKEAGTSPQTISAYEVGRKSPNLATVLRLADAAGLRMVVRFVPAEDAERRGDLAWTADPARNSTPGGPMRTAQRDRGII